MIRFVMSKNYLHNYNVSKTSVSNEKKDIELKKTKKINSNKKELVKSNSESSFDIVESKTDKNKLLIIF